MDENTHTSLEIRLTDANMKLLNRIAAIADVTRDQAGSVLFALWCVHNLPASETQP